MLQLLETDAKVGRPRQALHDLWKEEAEPVSARDDQKKNEREPWWASAFTVANDPSVRAIKMKVRRGQEELEAEFDLRPDATWPLAERAQRQLEHVR